MFWRKKKSDELLFEVDESDRRRAVRIKPSEPLYIETTEHRFVVVDISACGVAFQSTVLMLKEQLKVSLRLPDKDENDVQVMQCEIQVLNILEGVCHCAFIRMDVYNQMHLDRYILNEQKRQIRSEAKNRAD